MNDRQLIAALLTALVLAPLWACGPQRAQTSPAQPKDVLVLMPDPETGNTGHVVVSNNSAKVDLDEAREATRVSPGQAPSAVTVMSEGEVRQLFGDVMSSLPPPPLHYTVYFRFESDVLTDESRTVFAEALQAVKDRPVPEVAVVGHTDTPGTPEGNFELGLKRAQMVRALLLEAGLEASFIEVRSHGEGDLLVPTADNVFEPRNRRVEITIR
jgi:outer membrane protein OmpA-like peptidoglycan-associated protein